MQKLLAIFFIMISITFQGVCQDFEQWKKDRKIDLLSEDGWVNLAGLIWLEKEINFLNRDFQDSLILSSAPSKKNIGSFQIQNDSVWFIPNSKLVKKNKFQPSSKILQFPVSDNKNGAVYFDRWKWSVIYRGGQFGIRLRDLMHQGLADFEGIEYFEYDSILAVKAFFQPKFNETIEIPNVLGQVIEWKVMGILKFDLYGKNYELTALDEAGKLFVIFSDLTNQKETYPTGRYLYVNYPDKNGISIIDFNFSYNPPCAFTAFATCPIPPKVNRLKIAIQAGEMMPKGK